LNETSKQPSRYEKFVAYIFARCEKDKGVAARLKRAGNPDTEYQCWELLANWGVDLERHDERLPYATISSAIAVADAKQNGSLKLGQAIALCYEDGRESDAAKAKLRRLLACSDVSEVCRVLRPLLSLSNSRVSGHGPLDYARLLDQLLRYRFDDSRERVRAQWAQEFYGKVAQENDQEAA